MRGLLRTYFPPISPSRLMGRYMGAERLSWQIGFALGAALGCAELAVSPTGVWIAAAALCAIGAGSALAIEGTLPSRARRTPSAVPVSALKRRPRS